MRLRSGDIKWKWVKIGHRVDNMRVYKKIPDHLMRDLKLSERRMWRRSDGMFVVQYNRDKEPYWNSAVTD